MFRNKGKVASKINKCSKCKENITPPSLHISCKNCSNYFHTNCVHNLGNNNNWWCDLCFFKICFNELPFADKLIDYTFSLSKGLKIAHLNIQSLRNKIDHLNILLHDNNIDILCITETWLTNEIYDSEISIPGYSICRNDRDNLERGHGGIINYIRNGINYIDRTSI